MWLKKKMNEAGQVIAEPTRRVLQAVVGILSALVATLCLLLVVVVSQ